MLYEAPYLPYFYIYFHHASCLETIPASGCPKVPGLGRSWKLFGEGGHSGVRSDSTHVPHISQLRQRNGWKWIKVPSTKVTVSQRFFSKILQQRKSCTSLRCDVAFCLFFLLPPCPPNLPNLRHLLVKGLTEAGLPQS